jgi:GNAT superfamily N-acetyltransferase
MVTLTTSTKKFSIRFLEADDCSHLASAFLAIGWNKPKELFDRYLKEQHEGKRLVAVAFDDNEFAGYGTVIWQSQYPRFAAQAIPEINDLNVLPQFRCQGIASRLLDTAEEECLKRSATIGIGVGLYADYGAAQRLYVKRGYVPDGRGVTYHNKTVEPGGAVHVDDDFVLWFTKQ